MTMSNPLLQIKNLSVGFYSQDSQLLPVVDKVNLELLSNETLGIVGESGCGKSVTVRSIMRLFPPELAKTEGEILFQGENLMALSEKAMQKVRGKKIGMIFQEPMTSLNPVFTIGNQLIETCQLHLEMSAQAAKDHCIQLLKQVQINDPERVMKGYPHHLSGGMRQRVMIAMALSCNPLLLLADEPTTALDVTVQAQVLKLLRQLKDRHQMSVIFITHDFGVVAEVCDKVAVMYLGSILEYGEVNSILDKAYHPYTLSLLKSIPQGQFREGKNDRLFTIPGNVPAGFQQSPGCPFVERCFLANNRRKCYDLKPKLVEKNGRLVACHYTAELV